MAETKLSKHFSRDEIACHHCGRVGTSVSNLSKLLALLERIRERIGRPLRLTCAYRCPAHNKAVGGVPKSYHTQCMAADCYTDGMSVDELADAARECGAGGVGRYYGAGFVHVDCGPGADWTE